MLALRYGCVPIVRRTGGLVDTVEHYVPAKGMGTGYCFDRYEPLDLFTCMVRAWEAFQFKEQWRELQKRGMAKDFSWNNSAKEYIHLYRNLLGLPEEATSTVPPVATSTDSSTDEKPEDRRPELVG
jgi:starch synthase